MLKLFFSIQLIFAGSFLFGQVISDLIPQPGSSFVFDPFFTIDSPGDSGTGIIWDFGDVEFNSEYMGMYIDAQEVPGELSLPAGTIAMALYSETNHEVFSSYTFIDFSNASWDILGYANLTVSGTLNETVYEPSHEAFTLPLEYGSDGDGSYAYSYYEYLYLREHFADHTWEVDGSGTLILPNATYTDVLRIKMIIDEIELYDGALFSESQETSYWWFKEGIPYPLLRYSQAIISEIEDETVIDSLVFQSASAMISFDFSSGVANVVNSFVSPPFPNPGSDRVHMLLEEEFGQVSAYSVHDLTGKLLIRSEDVKQSGRQVEVDISRFSQGMYTLSLENGNNRITYKFVKQ